MPSSDRKKEITCPIEIIPDKKTSDFLGSIESEMNIEG